MERTARNLSEAFGLHSLVADFEIPLLARSHWLYGR